MDLTTWWASRFSYEEQTPEMDKSSEMKSDRGKGGKNREGYGGCIHISQLPQLFTFQRAMASGQRDL